MSCRIPGVLAAVLISLCSGASGADDPKRAYDTMYGAREKRVKGTPTRKDDVTFAKELLADTKKLGDSPGLCILLYEKAYELGIKHRDGYSTAAEAIQLLVAAAPARKAEADEKLLELYKVMARYGTAEQKKQANAAMLALAEASADRELAAGRTAEAVKMYRRAYSRAVYLRSSRKEPIHAKLKAAVARESLEKKFAVLARRLKAKPDDPTAARTLILLCVVELDDPAKALPYLDAARDEALKTRVPLAARDVKAIKEADVCRELGDWYRSLAVGAGTAAKLKTLSRAEAYYKRFLELRGDKQDAGTLAVKKALEKVGEDLLSASSGPGRPLDSRFIFYRSVLGIYKFGAGREYYPYVNLSYPDANLWSKSIQNKLRGKIPFEEIAYEGRAKLYVPSTGVHVLTVKGFRVFINGKDVGGSGEITLRKGTHDVRLGVGTHGQPYILWAKIRIVNKETKAQVPLVNSLAAIEAFQRKRLKGRKVTEVSGWDASKERPVRLKHK